MTIEPETAEATDVQRRFAYWKRKAQKAPVFVKNHGQDEIVLLSTTEYQRLKRRDREVLRLEDFTDDDIAEIMAAEGPAGNGHLDELLKDWKP